MSNMVFCSKCGSENKNTNNKCDKCGEFLLKPELFEAKNKEKFDEIFTKQNKKAINQITIESYNTVINNISYMGRDHLEYILKANNINVSELSILNKILLFTQAYTKISYKSSGADLGHYAYNSIFVDDRLFESQQIATLIHELTHHLFSEIIEELLMYVWECGKSDAIEALSWFIVTGSPMIKLSNEYCAHTCEGRFVPHGYQNYGSFNKILNEEFDPEKDQKNVNLALIFGNTIAHDILNILENFIGPGLREEIKQQFKEDTFPPKYDQIALETDEILPDEVKIKVITDIINSGFDIAQDENMYEILENFKTSFKEINNIQE